MKQFVGVYYNAHSWQIIPKEWIFTDTGVLKCYWPRSGNVTALAKRRQSVNIKTWSQWPIILIKVAETSGG